METRVSRTLALLLAVCGPLVVVDGCSSAAPPVVPAETQHLYGCYDPAEWPDTDPDDAGDSGPSIVGQRCVKDGDCLGGFCDRGVCVLPMLVAHYGSTCGQQQRYWGRSREPVCGGYLCLVGVCRSCQSDAECQKWAGPGTTCMPFGNWPGKLCATIDPVDVCANGNPRVPTELFDYTDMVGPHTPSIDYDAGPALHR